MIRRIILILTYSFLTISCFSQTGIIRAGLRLFESSAAKKSLGVELERLSQQSMHFATEREASQFLQSNSVLLSERRYLDTRNAFHYPNGNLSLSDSYERFHNGDLLVFTTPTEKDNYLYLIKQGKIDPLATDQLRAFQVALNSFANSHHLSADELKGLSLAEMAENEQAKNVLIYHGFMAVQDKQTEVLWALMQFQKTFKLKITGKLDKATYAIMKDLTPSINPNWWGTKYYSALMFERRRLATNYYEPYMLDPAISPIRKNLLDYLGSKKFIPTDHSKCSYLVVERGLLKFQAREKLPLTGKLDALTGNRIFEKINSTPVEKFFPNFSNEVPPSIRDDDNFFLLEEFMPEFNLKVCQYSGFSYLKPEIFNDNLLMCHFMDAAVLGPMIHTKQNISGFLSKAKNYISAEQKQAFIITTRYSSGESICILYALEGKISGYIHSSKFYTPAQLKKELLFIKRNGFSFMWAGDELSSLNIMSVADGAGLSTLRRIPHFENDLMTTSFYELQPFAPSTAAVHNAVPSTELQMRQCGFSKFSLPGWIQIKNEVDQLIENKFEKQILTKEELKDEIVNGKNNILTIVAHSDGMKLYAGDEPITIDDIKNWETRVEKLTTGRTALLLVCNAGNPNNKGLYQKRMASLSEVFINKGYFTNVIAPDHVVNPTEVKKIIGDFLNNNSPLKIRKDYKGWHHYVDQWRQVTNNFLCLLRPSLIHYFETI